MKTESSFALGYVFVSLTVALTPMLIIWSLNQLGSDIPYTVNTWTAVAFLVIVFRILITQKQLTEKES